MTRCAIAWIAALVLAATDAMAQPPDRPDPIRIPSDGQSWRIERIADIPRQLRAAIDRHPGCRLDETFLREAGVHLFRPAPGSSPMALVPCSSIIGYSQGYVFERGATREPHLMMFPVATQPGGFGASERPGMMTWDPSARTLVAIEGNDLCTATVARYTYRHGSTGLNGFALVKIEVGKACGADDWKPIWEAQPWTLP